MKTLRAITFLWFGGLTAVAVFFDKPASACVFALLMVCLHLDEIADILKEKAAHNIKEKS